MLGGTVAGEELERSAEHNSHSLTWDGLYNVRDLGGHPTPFGRTRFGAVVRSEALTYLGEAGRSALFAYGIRTIIDLRSPGEAAAEEHPLRGLAGYRHLPLLDDQALGEVAGIPEAEQVYAYMLDRRGEQLATILRVTICSPTPLLIHCKAGKDRTGVVVALLLANAGVGRSFIVSDYAVSERMLRPLYAMWARQDGVDVKADADAESMSRYVSRPEAMLAFLERLDSRYGGPRSYLLSIGLTEAEVQALARLLLPPEAAMVTRARD
jgi:protein-tyrosine phosphatase